MPRFVLEIGTEELPPRFFPPALAQLRENAGAMLARARLTHGDVKVYGSPRRLVLIVEDMAAVQSPSIREERGPSARVAFDADGKPTKAAMGFARRHGVTPEDLVVRQTDQGEYAFAVIHEPEGPAKDALAAALPDLITGLSFPKSMRWGSGSLRFGRPVRWLLALVDEDVAEFRLGDLQSGRLTRGHPMLADGMFPVSTASGCESALEERFVVVEPERRRGMIEQQLREIAASENAKLVDGGLLEETTYLLEWPTAALGEFDTAYLRLPRPVLAEEMQHVQSYFPLEDQGGALLPRFIAVRDGGRDHLETVVAGWESVLRAKLIDASYFYDQDLKRALADRVDALQGVVFQESLGSMYEKAQRIRKIAAALAEAVGLDEKRTAHLDRAALLCKADLTTDMVTELSSLQGLMGREYALASGEPSDVAEAIGEHYRPRFAGDDIPRTELGKLLAMADKIDTIAACFAVGIVPTGSADPYGLRREGSGVVSIAQEIERPLGVRRLVDVAIGELTQQVELKTPAEQIVADVLGFLRLRLDTYLQSEPPVGLGVRYDIAEAVLAAGPDDLRAAAKRAVAVQHLATTEAEFLPTVIASTRVSNIVKSFEGGAVDPPLFEHESERALWSAYEKVLPEADRLAKAEDYEGLFRLLGSLRQIIDRYFDDVLVMAEDGRVRTNRLATCWTVNQLFRRLADFSLIVQA